ncbi:transposase [Acetobacter malorum]|uniref:Transposase n=1 Tax=Acetobacter malorum TaxID=178901 RepID=A0A177GCW2_9PROT|nr:hypothetical protein [Acetobacter malorum]OAG77626.1 transposase [Acetobacter malorum]
MQAGTIKMLFNRFDAILRNAAYLPMPAPILDAHWWGPSNSATPTGEEEDLHAERIPETWKDKPPKRSHKGRLARWTLKVHESKSAKYGRVPSTELAIPFIDYKPHIFIV